MSDVLVVGYRFADGAEIQDLQAVAWPQGACRALVHWPNDDSLGMNGVARRHPWGVCMVQWEGAGIHGHGPNAWVRHSSEVWTDSRVEAEQIFYGTST